MPLLGLLIAVVLFFHFKRRLQYFRRERQLENDVRCIPTGAASWNEEWHRQWADKFNRQAERRRRHFERHVRQIERKARRFGFSVVRATETKGEPPDRANADPTAPPVPEGEIVRRARKRAAAQVGFYIHLMSYLGVIAFLALINCLTTSYPWFI